METPNTASNLNKQSEKREENIMKCLNRFYKSLLLLSLAVMPSAALALEPVMDGVNTTGNVVVQSASVWTSLISKPVTIPANSVFQCEVTCTSTVNVPFDSNSDNSYYYGAYNNTNLSTGSGCVRRFDTKEDASNIDDANKLVVASTCFTPNQSGTQTFHCLAQKLASGDLNLTVEDTSMHVICVDDLG